MRCFWFRCVRCFMERIVGTRWDVFHLGGVNVRSRSIITVEDSLSCSFLEILSLTKKISRRWVTILRLYFPLSFGLKVSVVVYVTIYRTLPRVWGCVKPSKTFPVFKVHYYILVRKYINKVYIGFYLIWMICRPGF